MHSNRKEQEHNKQVRDNVQKRYEEKKALDKVFSDYYYESSGKEIEKSLEQKKRQDIDIKNMVDNGEEVNPLFYFIYGYEESEKVHDDNETIVKTGGFLVTE